MPRPAPPRAPFAGCGLPIFIVVVLALMVIGGCGGFIAGSH